MIQDLYKEYFENRKITVMGLGLLGRGVGDTVFLARNEAELIVTDIKTESELASSLALLKEFPGITYHLGGHQMADFEQRDCIIKAAGVPFDSEFVKHAKDAEIPVYMSAALVTDIVMKHVDGVTIIGITGTRGKSTVTQMVAHILAGAGMKVYLGGNVRGVANLPLLEAIDEGDYLVMELDSWQLQGFGDLKISPSIAVFTSFMDDHMNYYKNDKEAYFKDKANIYRNQKEYDVLIASAQAAGEILMRDKVAVVVPEREFFEMKVIGEHNQVAARLAAEVVRQCGVSDDEIREALKVFPGVEGRLQDLGLFNNETVRVFNDNNATTGDATIAAIRAINETYNKKPILIVGGTDKTLSLIDLEQEILVGTKVCVYLEGSGTDKLTLLKEHIFGTLKECLDRAFYLAEEGDIILFSPGFASFSKHFSNEYERNDVFIQELERWKTLEVK